MDVLQSPWNHATVRLTMLTRNFSFGYPSASAGLIELDPSEPVIIVNFVTQLVSLEENGPDGKPKVLEQEPDAKRMRLGTFTGDVQHSKVCGRDSEEVAPHSRVEDSSIGRAARRTERPAVERTGWW